MGAGDRGAAGPQGRVVRWLDGATLDGILDRVASPHDGARVVARAWAADGLRARLPADAITALGLDMGRGPKPQVLRVVEKTDDVHNVIICTLCSCYPIALLGPSPSWYKSVAYRARVVRWPREVLAELGLQLDPEVCIEVWDSNAETRYLVLLRRPAGTQGCIEEELAAPVTRAGMIGTAAR